MGNNRVHRYARYTCEDIWAGSNVIATRARPVGNDNIVVSFASNRVLQRLSIHAHVIIHNWLNCIENMRPIDIVNNVQDAREANVFLITNNRYSKCVPVYAPVVCIVLLRYGRHYPYVTIRYYTLRINVYDRDEHLSCW